MKDKNLAAVLAFFGGTFGLHRFYLGQVGLGVLYAIFFPIAAMIGVLDAIIFLSMDQETFDDKYNNDEQYLPRRGQQRPTNRYDRFREREAVRRNRGRKRSTPAKNRGVRQERPRASNRKVSQRRGGGPARKNNRNPDREVGLQYYKDYAYEEAIEAFERSLRVEPKDIATHWNLACCYSLTEDADKAIYHLDRAVAIGFNDFERIREHDALAYLRIQPAFIKFQENDYRLSPDIAVTKDFAAENKEKDLLSQPAPSPNAPPRTNNDLLDQLQRLGQLREKGLLTEAEFAAQKRKLLG